MKNIALITNMLILTSTGIFAQSHGEMETLNARLNLNEAKIKQLESELALLKSNLTPKPAIANVPVAKAEATPATTTSSQYVVKKGDILTRIAHRHNTTVAAIKRANGLRDDRLNIGQKLTIPSSAPAKSVASAEKTPALTPAPVAKKAPATPSKHVTKKGETFYSIARTHGIELRSLIAANPDIHPSKLRTGQVLIIDANAKAQPKPVTKSTSTPAVKKAAVASTPAPKAKVKEVTRNTEAAKKPSSIKTITVYEQMTYSQFASKHGASTTQLNALNGLSLSNQTMLAKGSELYVPQL